MGGERGDVQRGICKWLKYTKERKIQNIFYQNDHYHYSQVTLEGCIIIIYTIPTTIVTSPPGRLGALLALQYLSSLDSTLLFGPRQFSWGALYALVQNFFFSEVDPFIPPIYIRIPVLAQKVGDVGTKYRPKIMQSIKQILHTTEYQPRTSTENRRYTTL